MKLYREDPDLIGVLRQASQYDLAVLIDVISDSGKGRISLNDRVKSTLLAAKQQSALSGDILLYIAEEIQKFGGNTIVSVFRSGKGVLYKEIVCDVASRLGANYNTSQDVSTIEGSIMLKVVEKALEKMSEEEKKAFFAQFGVSYTGLGAAAMAALIAAIRASGFYAYQLSLIIANATANFLLGRGLALGANAALTKSIGSSLFQVGAGIVVRGAAGGETGGRQGGTRSVVSLTGGG